MTTGTVHSEGADLVYDHEGDGPPLLCIAGGGGEASQFARISPLLAGDHTVIRYDRRGNSRSTGGADLDMAQQARDAAAVIRAVTGEPAFVFGNSGGGSIGFALAAEHPSLVRGLIAHEAPSVALLPDADIWMAFTDRVHATYLADGAAAAFKIFAGELVGFGTGRHEGRIGSGEPVSANAEYSLAHEYLQFARDQPDLDAIRSNGVPVATASGLDSADAYYARTARAQAERLRCAHHVFPGNHLGFMFRSSEFADALRQALDGLAPGRSGSSAGEQPSAVPPP